MIKQKNMHLNINTSFSLLNKETILNLKKYGVDHFHVSLWAANAEVYVKTHPNQENKIFNQITDNLKILRQVEIPFNIYNVLCKINFQDVEQMVYYGEKVGARSVEFALMDIIPEKTEEYALNWQERKKLTAALKGIKENKFNVEVWNIDSVIKRLEARTIKEGNIALVDSVPCVIGWMFCRILPNGDVVPCCKAHLKPMGNLHKQSFEEIWYSKKYDKFRYMALMKKKNHPFFNEINCYQACDNYVNNIEMLDRMKTLKKSTKSFLKIYSKLRK